jgi:hypothetical protein
MVRMRGIVLWKRYGSVIGRIIALKRNRGERIVRNVIESSSHTMKTLHSET